MSVNQRSLAVPLPADSFWNVGGVQTANVR